MVRRINRREMLAQTLGAGGCLAGGLSLGGAPGPATTGKKEDRARSAPTSPVAIQKCASYDPQVLRRAYDAAFDLLGGLKKIVENRTVTIKINLTGLDWKPVFGLAAQETYQTQPNTVAALCAALAGAGAKRIVIIENLYWEKPFEKVLLENGWDVKAIQEAGNHKVSFEDTRNRGRFPRYSRFKVPWGGFVYPAFDLNQRYEQTDVLVSLAKLKQHACAGITGAIKNFFGIAPTALYGNTAPDERGLDHRTNMFHGGTKRVPAGVPAELKPGQPRQQFVRVPRIVADLFGARPADLNIVEGIRTISGGEGHWNRGIALKEPKVLLVGGNGVCTDAVATAVMGFDPQAPHSQVPFPGDNHLALLAGVGIGTNDLKRIEILGSPIKQVVCPFGDRKS